MNIFLYYLIFFIAILIISVFVKRTWGADYDKKTLISNTLALLSCGFILFSQSTDFSNVTNLTTLSDKLYTTIAIVLLANGILQFIFWLFYTTLYYRAQIKMPRFLFNIFTLFFVIAVILYCIKYIFHQELTGLLVTSTVVSAIIGLALQDTLSNLISGLSLQLESPFKIDDWVKLGGFEGKVVSQNWRTVTILTRENHRVSLTNKFVAEDKIVNFSRPSRRQIHNFYIELDYSHPPNQVKAILRNLLNEIDEVDLDQNHGAFVMDYMESGIKYCLRYWLYDYGDILHIQDVVLSRLWYTLKRHKIKIPYPTSEVQMLMIQELEQQEGKTSQQSVIKFLSNQKWLKGMNQEKLKKLGKKARVALFADDDLIVRQGDEGDSMFILLTGIIRVLVNSEKNNEIEVAQKYIGEFFGEMSLLTGEPRTASIRAKGDCKVIIIDKESFSSLIISDEKILSEFVEVLVSCKSGIADAIEEEQQNSNITRDSAHKVIFNKIWSYLKMD